MRQCRCQRDVTKAEEKLHMVLLDMRKLLRLPRLEYVSIQNQADYLIEVPVENSVIPKVCMGIVAHVCLLP